VSQRPGSKLPRSTRRRRAGRHLALLAALWLVAPAGCRPTSGFTGSLTGTVQDLASAAVIPRAEVTMGAASARTDDDGQFVFEDLPIGNLLALVSAPGYRTQTQTVVIEVGDNRVVFKLRRQVLGDGGVGDGPAGDGPAPRDGGQRDAQSSCVGSGCTYGLEYGGCCAAAPYCVNYSGAAALVCRATCGAVSERCGYGADCCNGSCVSGYCAQPTCAGTGCTYGYYYGGCCEAAPYCANYSGAGSLVCRTTCGGLGERCAYGTDCCSGSCVSGACAQPSCGGVACAYGYPYGGCCASEPYCISYYSVATTTCSATCGQPSQHCQQPSDCCSGSCTFNSSAGWNICD